MLFQVALRTLIIGPVLMNSVLRLGALTIIPSIIGILLCGIPVARSEAPNLEKLPSKLNDYFQPFVWNTFSYDSNVFRAPNDPPLLDPNCNGRGATECYLDLISPGASKTDYINQLSVGTKVLVPFSRQLWTVNLLGANNSFVRNGFLNNISWDTSTTLNLEFAQSWTGKVGARYQRQLAGFGNFRLPGKDMLRFINYFGNVSYQITPRWRVTGGGDWYQTVHSLQTRQIQNIEATTAQFETIYATPLGNSIGLEYTRIQAKFPERPANQVNNFNQFVQDKPQLLLKYRVTEKLTFEGRAGYLWRSFDNAARDFSGEVWRLGMTWLPTDKTGLAVYGYHNIGTYFEEQSLYYFAEGAAIEPSWYPTDKTVISAGLNFESRDYPGSGILGNTVVANERHDNVVSARVSATYTPVDYADFSLVYSYGRRGVSGGIATEFFPYNFDSFGATARLYF